MNPMIVVEYTEQEANQLMNLLDIAGRNGGIQFFGIAHNLALKLQAAANVEAEDEEEDGEETI